MNIFSVIIGFSFLLVVISLIWSCYDTYLFYRLMSKLERSNQILNTLYEKAKKRKLDREKTRIEQIEHIGE